MFKGKKLKKLRLKKGLSVNLLSMELYSKYGLEVFYLTLRNWESGKTEPKASQLQILGKLFSKDINYFFD